MSATAANLDPRASVGANAAPVDYKLTEAGIIPTDWDVVRLGDIASIVNGATPRTQVPRYWNGSIPWCTPTDITDSPGKYLTETERSISEEGLVSCAAVLLPIGALLLCSRATVGEIKIAAIPVCTNQGFKSLVCWDGVSNEFLYYLLLALKPRLLERAIGSTFLEIGKRDVASIQIGLPPVEEQHAIAEALSDVDGLIEALEKLIAKKRAIKQAAMQQLLTAKTRLPGFSRKWTHLTLSKLGTFSKGRGVKRDDVSDDGFPCIRYGELYTRYHNYIVGPSSKIPPLVARTALRIKTGDLLFAGSGETVDEIGRCAAYLNSEPAYAGGDIVVLSPNKQNSMYLGHLMNHPIVAQQKARMGQGDAVVHISARNLAQVQVELPPVEEQDAIAIVLSDMDADIAALERRRNKTKQIKQGMMQQLLTGRVRLVQPSVPAERADVESKAAKAHSWAFNEAVVISTLVKWFSSEQFPLGRKRYTKLSYLLHRHAEKQAEGYLKKAAGPYNPKTRYGGPERIAVENGYIREHKSGPYRGFIAADNIPQAEEYFEKWYGGDCIQWLDQFRYKKNDELEVLATVDMAAEELRAADKNVDVDNVKAVIRSHPEWQAKLDRPVFSDTNIGRGIETSRKLFD